MRHLIMPLLAAGVLLLNTAPASADLGDQLFKLLPKNSGGGDAFGTSVAISGDTAIVGAYLNDNDNGGNSGSAYLFDITTGRQVAELLPDDGAEYDHFGVSVAISGSIAIIGAPDDVNSGIWSGSAYLFDITTGRQLFKLLPNDGASGDLFGRSVAISGATAIVGVPFDDDNGTDSGSVYLFDTTTGRQLFKLLPDDGEAGDFFGISVAINGTIAIVGAYFDDHNGFGSGSAYLFDTTTGRQIAKLVPNDGAGGDLFGASVAISGSIAIIGATLDDENGFDSGSAYLFDTTTGQQVAKLLAIDGAEYDRFGWSVAISGETAIVGAHRDDDNGDLSGSAYLFDTTTGLQIAKLLPNDGAASDYFGRAVAISGTTAIGGAAGDDDNNGSGSAYLFDASVCPWDIDDDEVVGVSDLLSLLASWGPCPPKGDCPADFDDSSDVGVKDLLFLLGAWGPCP